jgi:hypothetical protein
MKTLKLTHYSDNAHGWVSVKRSILVQLDLMAKISRCSYQSASGATVYLEEDGDALALVTALKAAGIAYEMVSKYKNGSSPIRSYPRFKSELPISA